MRKFRVYDKVEKRYVTDKEYWIIDKYGVLFSAYDIEHNEYILTKVDTNRYIVEYGTGELDKNKKEIFEGDIVMQAHKYIVVWNRDRCKFELLSTMYNSTIDIGGTGHFSEITGNIHEED